MVHLYTSMDAATARKKSRFILSDCSDFHMIDLLSIAVHAFALRILILSVDETILLMYVDLFTYFRGPPQSGNDSFSFKIRVLCFCSIFVDNLAWLQTSNIDRSNKSKWLYVKKRPVVLYLETGLVSYAVIGWRVS